MLTTVIPLRDDNPAVFLSAYVLEDSSHFQTGKRRPAIVICPGGGYFMTSDREAEPVALRFLARGYHAFVVRYSVQSRFPAPMLDLARAMLTIRQHADEWLVDPDSLAVCGFSAGGHLAASLGVFWDKLWLSEPLATSADMIRPAALILGYPVIDLDLVAHRRASDPAGGEQVPVHEAIYSVVLGERQPAREARDRYRLDLHVSAATPPTFLWHTAADELVLAPNALRFAAALVEHKVPFELHIFERGIHGLALADATTDVEGRFIDPQARSWIDLALSWLERRGQPGT
jgi:acetyl esterase/lipase